MESSSQPASEPQASPPPAPSQSVEGSVKETIESILVAFILAFIFRAFVVEAFVIPTGSMAPTLLGAHMRYRCPDCGYRYEVNFQGTEQGDDVNIPSVASGRNFTVFCPNCGYRLPRDNPTDPANVSQSPAVHYGDRILVLKYLYLFEEPARWDVVVFKSPHDPSRYDYTQNYIKRLVGKPGERIMILDGDIYVGKSDDIETFEVQTKPRHVQDALWRIVHDSDYHPRGLPRVDFRGDPDPDARFRQPWQPLEGQAGWTLGSGAPGDRAFRFSNPDGAATIEFDPSANPLKHALTDWLAYDVPDPSGSRDGYVPENNVSDVMLSLSYERHGGDGPLSLRMTKNDEEFEAQILPGSVTLLMNGRPLGEPVALPESRGPIKVEMMNADYQVSIWIDGKRLIATTPQQYAPDIAALQDAWRTGRKLPQPQLQIRAENQNCTLSHVSLWRDVYYLTRGYRAARDGNEQKPLWGTPRNPAVLDEDQYFVLGDNALVSLDARFWDDPIELPHEDLYVKPGVVPRRFMLGKAFFVYWPAGYRPFNWQNVPALAPNFGNMRFIH